HAWPGQLVIGCDSHTIMLGGLNCASTCIGETELAYAAAFGELWFRVPETLRIDITGRMPRWLCGKDIMLHLAGRHGPDSALYKSIEFTGAAVSHLSMDSRFTIADHGIEVGAKFALFECDDRTRALLKHQDDVPFTPVSPDEDAAYSGTMTVDVSRL